MLNVCFLVSCLKYMRLLVLQRANGTFLSYRTVKRVLKTSLAHNQCKKSHQLTVLHFKRDSMYCFVIKLDNKNVFSILFPASCTATSSPVLVKSLQLKNV